MQFGFGSGAGWVVESISNPTPGAIGIMQEASVDFARSVKELTGTYAFPVAVGAGTGKISGKTKFAQFSGRIINLFFGSTKATGQTLVAPGEAGTVPAPSGPYTVTVANSANFGIDLGVKNATTGIPLTRVASAPATGQYAVSAGVYTFAAADTGLGVKIDYTYSAAGSGETVSVANPLIGAANFFKAVFTQLYGTARNTLTLNANVFTKMGTGTKLEDFTMLDMDFSSFADSANNLLTWSFAEAS